MIRSKACCAAWQSATDSAIRAIHLFEVRSTWHTVPRRQFSSPATNLRLFAPLDRVIFAIELTRTPPEAASRIGPFASAGPPADPGCRRRRLSAYGRARRPGLPGVRAISASSYLCTSLTTFWLLLHLPASVGPSITASFSTDLLIGDVIVHASERFLPQLQ